ncbi:hypothetical protein Pmani_020414 [Petrolisthes manimaculis]|uniref:Uncharacterized protein n=1 Tax=Petrolisthes manimaculis TaxID=1843537 RepID=A0AAE1PGB9_9EUCA|nr:hypothetical protein Pmani_020414 [Petrolisthes manimaculis]
MESRWFKGGEWRRVGSRRDSKASHSVRPSPKVRSRCVDLYTTLMVTTMPLSQLHNSTGRGLEDLNSLRLSEGNLVEELIGLDFGVNSQRGLIVTWLVSSCWQPRVMVVDSLTLLSPPQSDALPLSLTRPDPPIPSAL